jgi:hypothetical protein
MIKKLKIGFLIAVLSLTVGIGSANAAVVSFTARTGVTIGSYGYAIESGTADSVAIDPVALTLTVVNPTALVFSSANKFLLTNDFSVTTVCSETQSSITLTKTGTVVITPSTSASTICPSSGAALSSGGNNSYVPPADTTPPSATSISINAGALTASSLSATLTLAATDATQMLISNDAGFAGATWETYAVSKAWTLTAGDGVKTVYAKFQDAAGNMSTAVSDMIAVSGTGTIAPLVIIPAPTQGCSGGNLYNTSTGLLCVNNAGAQIPGCGNRTTGFSTSGAGSCIGNRVITGTTTYNLGTVTLKNGSKGAAVMELQRLLNQVLSLGLVVDGKLGPKTIAVIKTWQKNHNLVADGLVGKLTKAAMKLEAE